MSAPITRHEAEQIAREKEQASRSAFAADLQGIYRQCPSGQYLGRQHYLDLLRESPSSNRAILANQRAKIHGLVAEGGKPDQVAELLGLSIEKVREYLGPLPIWAEGAALLDALDERRRAVARVQEVGVYSEGR